MARSSLATTISLLLGCVEILAPAVGFAAGEDHGSTEEAAERRMTPRSDSVTRGREAIEKGDAAMKAKDYEKATAHYRNACDVIPDDPKPDSVHRQTLDKFGDASVKLAGQRVTEGRYADAESVLNVVLGERYDPRCREALVLLSQLQPPEPSNHTISPKFRAAVEQVKQYLIEAQGFYDTGRYSLARKRCEKILNLDPYNQAAREFEGKIDRAMEGESTWGKREIGNGAAPGTQTDGSAAAVDKIRRKLEHIIIPKLEFRKATIREAIDFLKKKCVDLDTESPVGERGLSIVLKLDEPSGAATPSATPGAQTIPIPGVPPSDATPAPEGLDSRITVSLTNIPLIEALKYVTGLANLKFKIESYGISIVPLSASTDVLVTKEWKIPPDLIPRHPAAGGITQGSSTLASGGGASDAEVADASKGGSKIADRVTAKNWLIANGVTFNGAASAIYIIKSSRLIVRNTQDQLDLVDTIINSSVPGIEPTRVEVECKFVEIQWDNLKELNFDPLLKQFNVPASPNVFRSGPNIGTSPAIPADQLPFQIPKEPSTADRTSGGNHYNGPKIIEELLFRTNGASGKPPLTGALCGVFTDPQFQLIIRSLNQMKRVSILSVPKVTVRSGQTAVIEAIREFGNSAEDLPPQIPRAIEAGAAAKGSDARGERNAVTVSTTKPPLTASGENRSVSATVEVNPVVGPDGYTIDLNITPQFVEFDGFKSLGSPFTRKQTNPVTGVSQRTILTPKANNQPAFGTRKVTTSVSVFDGSTVVLNGVGDETSLFGDAPATYPNGHPKHQLLMFFSARLITEEVVEIVAPPEIPPSQVPLMPK